MAKNDSFFLEGKNNQGVLLCHSLAGDPSQMFELGKKLNKKGYSVSCPLYKGHGGSYEDIIYTDVEDWYKTLIDEYNDFKEKVEDIYVIGMSIGGTFTVKLGQEENVKGIVTINAPIIGFDIENDLFNFKRNTDNEELITRFREYRTGYFYFVTELGQIENIKRITCPLFVVQGSLDAARYKTSTQMLMSFANSEIKQRKDYPKSYHLALLENDKKELMKDIINFIEEN
ncbi:alpha/beta hydrolase [Candidatus Izimaplasma bacterium]|nr:alpha/beta hydrolase [Candidatus Izimaplasma bacterium]